MKSELMRAFPKERLQKVGALIELHRGQPDISLAAHVRRKMALLGQSVLGRRRIYMDQKYWILLRDAAMGRARNPAHLDLLNRLRCGAASGSLMCPVGESVFLELLKQSDLTTRQATAKLIDELSLGVTIECSLSRMGIEIQHFLSGLAAGNPHPEAPVHLVWTRIAHAIGVATPVLPGVSEGEMLAIQKAFDDFLWSVSLEEMLEESGVPDEDTILKMAASRITDASAAHTVEMRSFNQVFLAEVGGILDANRETVSDAFEFFARDTYKGQAPISSADRRQLRETAGNVLYNIFRYGKVQTELPSIRIVAGLFAAARWNRTRKFDSTDFYDFYHAAAALPYCNYFLTEKPLATMLTGRPLEFEKLYGTRIIYGIGDALQQVAP